MKLKQFIAAHNMPQAPKRQYKKLRLVLEIQVPKRGWKKLVAKGREWGCEGLTGATEDEIVSRALRQSASEFFDLAGADDCRAVIVYEV